MTASNESASAGTRHLLRGAAARAAMAWEACYVEAAMKLGDDPNFAKLAQAMRDLRRSL